MSKKELPLVGTAGCCAPLSAAPIGEEAAVDLARGYKALGDPVRLRLLSLIASFPGGEACVCDLTGTFDQTGPTISHHLRVLRESGLVTSERRGTWVYYAAVPQMLEALSALLRTPSEQASEAASGARPVSSRSADMPASRSAR